MAVKGTSAGLSNDLQTVQVYVHLNMSFSCVCIYVILQRSLHSDWPQDGEGR